MHKQFKGTKIIRTNEEEIKLDYYFIKEDRLFEEDSTPITTYGIEIVKNNIEKNFISDITTDKDIAMNILENVKENNVFPVHLHDVIEDLL